MIIQELRLYTPHLEAQTDFYSRILGWAIARKTEDEVCFQLGKSRLCFQKRAEHNAYHFALNIPSNQEVEAMEWLKKRVDILPYEGKEIQDFKAWNARAVYFYDADQNIVEYIARKNLPDISNEPFGTESILEISEIGIPVDDIQSLYEPLHNRLGLNVYSGSFDIFCAIGGERGLFIVVDQKRKDWFPLNDPANKADFEAIVLVDQQRFSLSVSNGHCKIHALV